MPSFRYRAVASNGAVVRGEVDAADRDGAAAGLQGLGHVLLQLDTAAPRSAFWTLLSRDISFSKRAGPKMVADLVARLSLLLDAGVSLEAALAMLGTSEGSATARAEASALLKAVRAGASLGDAMAARGTIFPALVVAMARAGEASGTQGCMLYDLIPNMLELRLRPLMLRFADIMQRSGVIQTLAVIS